MALVAPRNLIKGIQTAFPRGTPFDSRDLAFEGVSPALAYHYVESGWLTRLGRGAFTFSGDTLSQEGCLEFLARRIPGFHVGGKTALGWRGVRHNLPARESLSLWGEGRAVLPTWFTSRFPARYTTRTPFSASLPKAFGLQPLPEREHGCPVSVPERAMLEMLGEVGIGQEIEEARNILEGLRSLRPEVLEKLLKNCERVKVARLCVQWAEELDLPWASVARKAAGKHLGSGRWTARLKDGTTLVLKG